jgi:hypothetical protein
MDTLNDTPAWQTKALWVAIALLGAVSFGIVALTRGEAVNAAWLVVAAVCVYFIAYRFYGLFVANRAFLRNHAEAIAAIDLCVVPTLTFECLFAFLVLGHGRRQLLWFAVTRHPTAEWLAQQIVEAFPWGTAPTYLVRDNDRAYGWAFTNRVRTMGIRDRPISPRSPWQNAYVERVIGTLRRECLDHVLISGERHLRRILTLYSLYYNETRTHLGLGKDAPLRRSVQRSGSIIVTPILSGLHHR